MGLFSGLHMFGLDRLEEAELYTDSSELLEPEKVQERKPITEDYFLFEKSYTCPICNAQIKSSTMKTGKAKLLSTDVDLRTVYDKIDIHKYDAVVCPSCGYAALARYFQTVTPIQKKMIQTHICASYKPKEYEEGMIYSYEQAMDRYKLTLANTFVKKAKASEKAFVCLKSAWVLRGMAQSMELTDQSALFKQTVCQKQEQEYLENAFEGFMAARETETFPMCGMDEMTIDYLLCALAMYAGQYELALKMLGVLLTNRTTPPRIKDKCLELKNLIRENMNKSE